MVSEGFAKAVKELAAEDLAFRDDLRRRGIVPLSPEARLGLAFDPGQRVFDETSRQEGVILGGCRRHIFIQSP